MSLTKISKKIGLSVDSVRKRIIKMKENKIFHPQIQLRPRNFGFGNIVDVKMKLQYSSQEEFDKFINYLVNNPRVVEVLSVEGEWDLAVVLIAKDAIDLGNVTSEIRARYGKLINSWTSSLTLKSYKFEVYDMENVLQFTT